MKLLGIVLTLGIAGTSLSQRATTPKSSATGACSIAHEGNGDVITISNCGIGEAQGDKIIRLLREITKSRDTALINAKLDQVLEAASKLDVNSVDHSLVNQGINLGQQVVDNRTTLLGDGPIPGLENLTQMAFPGSPPPPYPRITKDMTASDIDFAQREYKREAIEYSMKNSRPGVRITFNVRGLFVSPSFLVVCESPCIQGDMEFISKEGNGQSVPFAALAYGTNEIVFASQGKRYLTPDVKVVLMVYSSNGSELKPVKVSAIVPQ